MALGDPYASLGELKERLRVTDTGDDSALTGALAAASRSVNQFCQRQFNRADTPEEREFQALTGSLLIVDDFHSADDLVIGGTEYTSGSHVLEPLNGVVDGEPGWPRWRIRGSGFTRVVAVSARWGWSQVPDSVREATLITAMEIFKMKDVLFGVQGLQDFGFIRVRENHRTAQMLAPYRRNVAMVG